MTPSLSALVTLLQSCANERHTQPKGNNHVDVLSKALHTEILHRELLEWVCIRGVCASTNELRLILSKIAAVVGASVRPDELEPQVTLDIPRVPLPQMDLYPISDMVLMVFIGALDAQATEVHVALLLHPASVCVTIEHNGSGIIIPEPLTTMPWVIERREHVVVLSRPLMEDAPAGQAPIGLHQPPRQPNRWPLAGHTHT